MLAALHALAALAETDQQAILDELEQTWRGHDGVRVDHLDGLTVNHADWWFNVRASNTQSLLRLNAEGTDAATMGRESATTSSP